MTTGRWLNIQRNITLGLELSMFIIAVAWALPLLSIIVFIGFLIEIFKKVVSE